MADRQVDKNYGSMRTKHGLDHASANGYVGEWFFRREQRFLTNRLGTGLILDAACGSALMLKDLGNADVIGLDYNLLACKQASANDQTIVRGDGFNMPFANQTFDAVINCQFLNQQTPAQRQQFIAEVSRVLKPGGHCHIMWRGAETLIHQSVNCASNILARLQGEPTFPQYYHPPQLLLQDAINSGFELVEQNMTAPLGGATVAPGSLTAKIIGASHYVNLRRLP
ncbi:MAG: class I SAM-dependent methyltransferase [Pseudomonadales bacterium]|jgi:SAM-dependent methyltransferase